MKGEFMRGVLGDHLRVSVVISTTASIDQKVAWGIWWSHKHSRVCYFRAF